MAKRSVSQKAMEKIAAWVHENRRRPSCMAEGPERRLYFQMRVAMRLYPTFKAEMEKYPTRGRGTVLGSKKKWTSEIRIGLFLMASGGDGF